MVERFFTTTSTSGPYSSTRVPASCITITGLPSSAFNVARSSCLTVLTSRWLAGAVLTEQVFTIPGFGKLIVDAVFNRDYGVVQGVVLCTAIGFILMNLLADVLYILVNPRLRTG